MQILIYMESIEQGPVSRTQRTREDLRKAAWLSLGFPGAKTPKWVASTATSCSRANAAIQDGGVEHLYTLSNAHTRTHIMFTHTRTKLHAHTPENITLHYCACLYPRFSRGLANPVFSKRINCLRALLVWGLRFHSRSVVTFRGKKLRPFDHSVLPIWGSNPQ